VCVYVLYHCWMDLNAWFRNCIYASQAKCDTFCK
jgi:hypothetical protein